MVEGPFSRTLCFEVKFEGERLIQENRRFEGGLRLFEVVAEIQVCG